MIPADGDDLAACATLLSAASTADDDVRALYVAAARQAHSRAVGRVEALRPLLASAEAELVRRTGGAR